MAQPTLQASFKPGSTLAFQNQLSSGSKLEVANLTNLVNSINTAAQLYDVSAGSDLLSKKNPLAQAAYEAEEESIADMIRQFEVGRNWNYVMGFADILKQKIPDEKTLDEYSRAVGFPSFHHLLKYGRAVESAYMQGLSADPMSLDTTALTAYYAYVIASREDGGKAIMDAFDSGSDFILTPIEKAAYDLARSWQATAREGGQLPPEANLPDQFRSVVDKWDNPTGTFTGQMVAAPRRTAAQIKEQASSSIDTPKATMQSAAQQYVSNKRAGSATSSTSSTSATSTAISKVKANLSNKFKKPFGSIIPNSESSIMANTAKIFMLIGIAYATMQAYEYLKSRK